MSSSNKLKVLLDTTYLLPIVGIDVEGVKEVLVLLGKLRNEDKAIHLSTYLKF